MRGRGEYYKKGPYTAICEWCAAAPLPALIKVIIPFIQSVDFKQGRYQTWLTGGGRLNEFPISLDIFRVAIFETIWVDESYPSNTHQFWPIWKHHRVILVIFSILLLFFLISFIFLFPRMFPPTTNIGCNPWLQLIISNHFYGILLLSFKTDN